MEVNISFLDNNVQQFQELLLAFEDAFEWEDYVLPDEKYLEKILQKPDFLVVVASNNGKIVGGLTAYVLHGYQQPKPFIYIYDLGIRHEFQNKGIGRKIISFLQEFAFSNGFEEIYVTTEAEDNEQALSFYQKTKPDGALNAVQFNYLPSSEK